VQTAVDAGPGDDVGVVGDGDGDGGDDGPAETLAIGVADSAVAEPPERLK
jgi:hypothetical protein